MGRELSCARYSPPVKLWYPDLGLDGKLLVNWANLRLGHASEYDNNYSHPDKKN